jgi:hypothetical protein
MYSHPQTFPRPPYNRAVRDLVQGKRAWSPALAKDEIKRGLSRTV